MGLLNIIRRMHLREKLSIREIARRTGLLRDTVSRHLAANTIEPRFATPERRSKLDPFSDKLAGWLKTEAGKSRKQRRTLKQMHADLVKLGFAGSCNLVAAFARDWRTDRQREQQTAGRGTFVPLFFSPGEAFQFDWSDDFAILGGERYLGFRWPTSSCRTAGRFCCALISYRPTRCCLTPTGMDSGFLVACLPGASTTVRPGRHGSEAWPNEDGSGPCRPRQGTRGQHALPRHDKPLCLCARVLQSGSRLGLRQRGAIGPSPLAQGQVEKNVRDSRHQLLQGMPDFADLAALNAWLEQHCLELWAETAHGSLPGTIADVWAEERAALMPLPSAFDGFIELGQARLAHLPDQLRAQSLQRSRVLCEPACQSADLSGPAGRGGRGQHPVRAWSRIPAQPPGAATNDL